MLPSQPSAITLNGAGCGSRSTPARLAEVFSCQCWFSALVTLAGHARSWVCSHTSRAAKNLTLFGGGSPSGLSSRGATRIGTSCGGTVYCGAVGEGTRPRDGQAMFPLPRGGGEGRGEGESVESAEHRTSNIQHPTSKAPLTLTLSPSEGERESDSERL